MKKHLIYLLFSLIFIFSSCAVSDLQNESSLQDYPSSSKIFFNTKIDSSSDTISKDEIKEYTFQVNYVFEHNFDTENEQYKANLTFNYSFLGNGFNNIKFPNYNLVAGDLLKIYYTGNLFFYECYPSIVYLDGEILSYEFIKTEIINISFKDTTLKNLYDKFDFKNEYVINKDNTYLNLNSYDGNSIYLSIDKTNNTKLLDSKILILGIYSFNPRFN